MERLLVDLPRKPAVFVAVGVLLLEGKILPSEVEGEDLGHAHRHTLVQTAFPNMVAMEIQISEEVVAEVIMEVEEAQLVAGLGALAFV